jgi:hypothetical protein
MKLRSQNSLPTYKHLKAHRYAVELLKSNPQKELNTEINQL